MIKLIVNNPNKVGSPFVNIGETKKDCLQWLEEQKNKKVCPFGDFNDCTISFEVIVNEEQLNHRDNILCKTDWLFVSDNPVPSKHRMYYKNYRNMLRNLDLKKVNKIEEFDHYLRRTAPEQFMDGGESKKIIDKFYYYIRK